MLKVYILLLNFVSHKVTVTGPYDADILHKLHVAIKQKRRGKLTQTLTFARQCTYLFTMDRLLDLNPDLKKCVIHHILLTWYQVHDYHTFPNLEKRLRGQRFSTDDERMQANEEWLKKLITFLFYRHPKLRDRYKLCINKGGDYVEKQMYAHPSFLF